MRLPLTVYHLVHIFSVWIAVGLEGDLTCCYIHFFGLKGFHGEPLGQISHLPEHPHWPYALIAKQQHSPLCRMFYPAEDCLSSRCLTLVIIREVLFPS